jgi:hypothetical protein
MQSAKQRENQQSEKRQERCLLELIKFINNFAHHLDTQMQSKGTWLLTSMLNNQIAQCQCFKLLPFLNGLFCTFHDSSKF